MAQPTQFEAPIAGPDGSILPGSSRGTEVASALASFEFSVPRPALSYGSELGTEPADREIGAMLLAAWCALLFRYSEQEQFPLEISTAATIPGGSGWLGQVAEV